jgi:O-antigen ligase
MTGAQAVDDAITGNPIVLFLLLVLGAIVGLPTLVVGLRKTANLLLNAGAARWIYLAWFLLLASTLVWSVTQSAVNETVDGAGSGDFIRLGFLLLGVIATLITGTLFRFAFVGHLVTGVLAIFSLFALWCFVSTLWSILPAVTLYKSFEFFCALMLISTAMVVASSRSVARTSKEQVLQLKSYFDWHWSLVFLLLCTVYVGAALLPGSAFVPSAGILGFQLQGAFPQMATNAVGDFAAILGTVSLTRVLSRSGAISARSKLVYLLVLGFSLLALFLAQSRSPIIAFLLAAIIVSISYKRFWLLLIVVSLSPTLFLNYGEVTTEYLRRGQVDGNIESLSGRITYWQAALEAVGNQPLGGYGAYAGGRYILDRAVPGASGVSSLHNTYMEALAGTGIVGLGILIAGLGVTWFALLKLQSFAASSAVSRLLWVESLGILVVLSVRSMFSVPFIWTNVLTFGLILIYVTVLGRLKKRTKKRRYAGTLTPQPLSASRR